MDKEKVGNDGGRQGIVRFMLRNNRYRSRRRRIYDTV
jgi:hypothetical protein